MVDWSLARQIARFAAGSDDREALEFDFAGAAEGALGQVSAYSGLTLDGAPPPVHEVGRHEWASANLDLLADLLDPSAEPRRARRGGTEREHGVGRLPLRCDPREPARERLALAGAGSADHERGSPGVRDGLALSVVQAIERIRHPSLG